MASKYSEWTRGQDEALLNKLGGMEIALKLLTCDEVRVTFDSVDKRATITADAPVLKVWKTIKIGGGITNGKGLCSELEKKDFRIGDWARDMLLQPAFIVAAEETEVDLVVMSVADLGFKNGARYDQICARAIELGLELCPAEVGPQLRLQYPGQPRGEWLLVAMEAIRDSDGSLRIFSVGHDEDGRWLYGSCGNPDSLWRAGRQFVFRSRKQSSAA